MDIVMRRTIRHFLWRYGRLIEAGFTVAGVFILAVLFLLWAVQIKFG